MCSCCLVKFLLSVVTNSFSEKIFFLEGHRQAASLIYAHHQLMRVIAKVIDYSLFLISLTRLIQHYYVGLSFHLQIREMPAHCSLGLSTVLSHMYHSVRVVNSSKWYNRPFHLLTFPKVKQPLPLHLRSLVEEKRKELFAWIVDLCMLGAEHSEGGRMNTTINREKDKGDARVAGFALLLLSRVKLDADIAKWALQRGLVQKLLDTRHSSSSLQECIDSGFGKRKTEKRGKSDKRTVHMDDSVDFYRDSDGDLFPLSVMNVPTLRFVNLVGSFCQIPFCQSLKLSMILNVVLHYA